MTIPRKGWVLVAIPLFAQLVFLGVLLMSREHQQYTQKKAIHTNKVMAQVEACHRQVVEAQTHMRGFLLTENPQFVEAYERSRRQIPEDFQKLAELVEDNRDQDSKVHAMKALAGAILDWMNQNIRLTQQGKRQEAIHRLQPTSGVSHVSLLRKEIQEFLDEERRLDQLREERFERALSLQVFVLFGGVALAVASSFTLLLTFSRSISQRVAVVIDNTTRFAEGKDLAPPLGGSDELRKIDEVFHAMATSIRQKEQENELFVYSVSHDLRSPLVNLQGFSQELSMVIGELRELIQESALPEAAKARANQLIDRDAMEAIRFIQTAVTRLSGIIDALLRLSRIGRVDFRKEEVDVDAVVRRVVTSLNNSLTRSKAEVQLGELPPCWGDPRAVDQIFANLIGNAINYLDPDRPGRIEVGVAEDTIPGATTYFVKDNGRGIPEHLLGKVFIAFQRLHPEAAPGEGVGLALVRRVVERLGGKVWAQSREGTGSIFYVILPQSQDFRVTNSLSSTEIPLAPSPPARSTMDSSAEWKALSPDTKGNP